MKYYISLLYLCLSSVFVSQAQEPIQVFFEKAPNNKIRFFYDKDYFLVDKNCEFRYIERVAGFDLPSNKLHGDFQDFDPLGSILLSGTYANGYKNGEFLAYYPNGTLKWQSSFINNVPHGKTIFYYPDGKPMLELRHDNKITYIDNYWDKTGLQSVKNGEGKIDIILPIMGYTEHGYTKYNIIGNITKGFQNGLWKTAFLTEGKRVKSIPFLTESYINGSLLKRKINAYFEDVLIDISTLNYFPSEPFTNAEFLQSKNCTFDEHTGFNNFIAQKFSNFLNKNNIQFEGSKNLLITYTINVSKNGEPFEPTITATSVVLDSDAKVLVDVMIDQIYYYLPSYLDNKPIEDKLSISFEIRNNGKVNTIAPVQIKREKGF